MLFWRAMFPFVFNTNKGKAKTSREATKQKGQDAEESIDGLG